MIRLYDRLWDSSGSDPQLHCLPVSPSGTREAEAGKAIGRNTISAHIDPKVDWLREPDLNQLKHARQISKQYPARAKRELEALAERGSVLSMLDLGRLHAEGIGTAPNRAEGERWFRRAANTGSARAYYFLASLYLEQERFEEAKDAVVVAADKNFVPAIYLLGTMYLSGLGVPRDVSTAVELLSRASKAGSVFATGALSRILRHSENLSDRIRGFILLGKGYFDLLKTVTIEGFHSDRLL